jgi:RecA/RadA recombinase
LVRIDFDIAETIFEQVKTLIKSGAVSTVVIDSIAALHPQMDANADYQDTVMASKARLLSRVLPEFAMLSKQYNVLIIFINQLRFKIGTYGTPEDTPGGKSLKYFAHMRIECRYYSNKEAGLQMKILDSHGDMIGQRVLVKFVKNKFAPPHREGMFELYFAAPDMVRNVIFAAKKQKLWFIRAGVHKYTRGDNEPITADSEENFVKALIVNDCVQELAEKLIAKSSELKENVLPDKFDADELLKKIDEYKEQIFNEEESKTEIYEEQFEDFGDVIKDKE